MTHHIPRGFFTALVRCAAAGLVVLVTGCAPPKPPALIDLSLSPLVPVETVHLSQVRLAAGDRNFEVLFSPYVGMPDAQTDRAAFPVRRAGVPGAASVVLDLSVGESFLGAGWAYIWGRHPYGTTTRGAGTSEGSVLLVQRDALRKIAGVMTYVDRFFFLEGSKMKVENVASPPDELVTTVVNTYIDVDSDGNLYPVTPIPSSGAIFSFVNNVIIEVATAGNPTPGGWPP